MEKWKRSIWLYSFVEYIYLYIYIYIYLANFLLWYDECGEVGVEGEREMEMEMEMIYIGLGVVGRRK